MRVFSSVFITLLLAMPAMAQPWYARGEFNAWGTDHPMTDQGGGHFTANITGLFDDAPYNWKGALADWSTAMPGSDGRVYTNATGGINFHLYDQTSWDDGWLPNNARRVGYDDHQQFDWEIVGSFNDWPGTHDPNFALTDMGNGLHRGTFTFDADIYDFKFRGVGANATNAWDTSIGNDFGNGAGNNSFVVANNGDEWTFELDLPNGRFRYFTDAVPDLDGDYNEDGSVDAADYVVWRKDPAGHGGAQGYTDWRTNFGATGGGAVVWLARSPTLGNLELDDQGGGVFTKSYTGLAPGSDHDVRIARSDLSEQIPEDNMKVRANAAGEISLKFYELAGESWGDGWSPSDAHRVGYVDSNEFDWEIVGEFNTWPGVNDPAYALVDQGNGLHTGTFTFSTPDTYSWKFRQIAAENPWNTSIGADFSNSAPDNMFTVATAGEMWTFELDLPNGRWRAFMVTPPGSSSAVPEPATVGVLLLGAMLIVGMRRK